MTYGGLIDYARSFAQVINKRSLVFVLCKNNVGGCLGFTCCLITRNVPLLLSAEMDKGLLNNLIETYHPTYIFEPEEMVGTNDEEIFALYGYSLIKTGLDNYELYDNLSLLLTTSGSTGSPKLVRHSYDNIYSQARNISSFFEISDNERPLLDLPIHYTMGLSVLYSHLFVGATVYVTDMNVLDADYWTFVESNHITSLTNIPYTFELMYRLNFLNMDLPDLRLVTQGGGKLKEKIYKAYAEYAEQSGRRFIPTYGQTEGTARMAFLPYKYSKDKICCIGKAIPEGKLYLIDETDKILSNPNMIGELVYEGPNVTLGYALKGEDLSLGDERQGILRTGDLARMDEDGFFYIEGRKGRFLKINGHRVGLDECEQIIINRFGVDCACIGSDESVVVYINSLNHKQQAKEYLAEITNLNVHFFDVRYIERIPRSKSGKVMYSLIGK